MKLKPMPRFPRGYATAEMHGTDWAPKNPRHLMVAIHEAGHATIAHHTPYAIPSSCYVYRCSADGKKFAGASGADWQYPDDYAPELRYKASIQWTIGGHVAEHAVATAAGKWQAGWYSQQERAAAINTAREVFEQPELDRIEAEATAHLHDNWGYFERLVWRMMHPTDIGQHGVADLRGYFGIRRNFGAAWDEWMDTFGHVKLSGSAEKFAKQWQYMIQPSQRPYFDWQRRNDMNNAQIQADEELYDYRRAIAALAWGNTHRAK